MSVDLITTTPQRMRFLVSELGQPAPIVPTVITLTNAQLVAFALEPFKTILQQPVDSLAEARRLLLGVGAPGDVFRSPSAATQPTRHGRVRVNFQDNGFTVLIGGLGIDAAETGGRADLVFSAYAYDEGPPGTRRWIVDFELEDTYTR